MSNDNELIGALRALETEALVAIDGATDEGALEAARVRYLGRKEGRVSGVLRRLGELAPDQRPQVGAEANRVKAALVERLDARAAALVVGSGEGGGEDLTLPGRTSWSGGRHPVTLVMDEIWGIFRDLGFTRARGPEADTEWYNFVALNTPLDHPAADEQDTLYLDDSVLLRSHTSPVQIRTLEAYRPPVRIIAPGWVYRRDTYDATHTPAFLQIEGLVVDEGVTFVDFKATLAEFARRFWGPGTKVRFRPSFFPFTEPSAEVDVRRLITHRDGTRAESDWIEIMGAGMVDPAVLDNVGVDPERYTGFAFGMGPARIAMLKYGVPDLRLFFENDMRFLGQFAEGG
ncbi:MAG TPA: phenylalanine--tRNA ligase subunit alpha [Longimicrobiales bacterium]|jgi:phenylalanyl-tRNA synthetase alpha chain